MRPGRLLTVLLVFIFLSAGGQLGARGTGKLVPVPKSYVLIPHDSLIPAEVTAQAQRKAIYPRIKKLRDGKYIMTYQGGRLGPRIFCSLSDDLIHWSRPKMLLEPGWIEVGGQKDLELYSTMDMAVMPDGQILAVCSFRARKLYSRGIGCGLVLMRSHDGGLSWSSPEKIYDGANWEPYILRLPDGSLQIYFTDTTPSIKSSGTSVITSYDGGKTWSPKVWASRHYKYDADDGTPVYTDQMPCFRLLNDGKTLFGILEARIETPEVMPPVGKSEYWLSVVRADGTDWGMETAAWKEELFMPGAAGYVSVFPSGEIVLSCNVKGSFMMRIVPSSGILDGGDSWDSGWREALPGHGYWGCTEITGEDTLVCAMHCAGGMQIRQFRLK
mgnify:CR=1 FL=1